jgi:DNA-binding NarL/FixJ family response regulator
MRVLIVEDLNDTRRWLTEIVAQALPDCAIHQATTQSAALSSIARQTYDLALIDLGLPDGSGLEVLRKLRQIGATTICVVTTIMGDDASIVGALAAGADGYLLKEQPREILVMQLSQVVSGVPALSPSVARRIMQHFQFTGPVAHENLLTAREKDVLALIGNGLRNAEVAQALNLSENTIASYIKGIYRKLGISSRAEASWHAVRLGLHAPR